MAKDAKPENEAEAILDEEPKAAPKSKRLFVLLGLVVLILLETIVMVLLLPSTQKGANQPYDGIEGPDFNSPGPLPIAEPKAPELVEKPLGDKFQIQEIGQSGETDLFTVTITLKVAKTDEKKFDDLYVKMPNTIRGIVYTVLRASSIEERKQETLGAIRQKIRIRINEELGANYVRDVVCTDPSVGAM